MWCAHQINPHTYIHTTTRPNPIPNPSQPIHPIPTLPDPTQPRVPKKQENITTVAHPRVSAKNGIHTYMYEYASSNHRHQNRVSNGFPFRSTHTQIQTHRRAEGEWYTHGGQLYAASNQPTAINQDQPTNPLPLLLEKRHFLYYFIFLLPPSCLFSNLLLLLLLLCFVVAVAAAAAEVGTATDRTPRVCNNYYHHATSAVYTAIIMLHACCMIGPESNRHNLTAT